MARTKRSLVLAERFMQILQLSEEQLSDFMQDSSKTSRLRRLLKTLTINVTLKVCLYPVLIILSSRDRDRRANQNAIAELKLRANTFTLPLCATCVDLWCETPFTSWESEHAHPGGMEGEESSGEGSWNEIIPTQRGGSRSAGESTDRGWGPPSAPDSHVLESVIVDRLEWGGGESAEEAAVASGAGAAAHDGDLDDLLQWLSNTEVEGGVPEWSETAALIHEQRSGSLEPDSSTVKAAAAAAAATTATTPASQWTAAASSASALPSEPALFLAAAAMKGAAVLPRGSLTMADGAAVVSMPGRDKMVGTCHKCGSSLLGTKPSARCVTCSANFHTNDCGGRLAKAGLDVSLLEQCPRCARVCQCSEGPAPCHAHATKKRRREREREKIPASSSSPTSVPAANPASTAFLAAGAAATIPTTEATAAATMNELVCVRAELLHVRAENVSLRAALRDALRIVENFLSGGEGGRGILGRPPLSRKAATGADAGADFGTGIESWSEAEMNKGPVALMEGAEGDLRSLLTRRALKSTLAVTYPYATVSLVSLVFHTLNVKEKEMRNQDVEEDNGGMSYAFQYTLGTLSTTVVTMWVVCLQIAARRAVGRRRSLPPPRDYLAQVIALIVATAVFGVGMLQIVGLFLLNGTGEALVKMRFCIDDETDIHKIAMMEMCLIGLQVSTPILSSFHCSLYELGRGKTFCKF